MCLVLGNSKNSIHSSIEETKVTLVFFLGGCTYAEISALRFLSKRDDGQYSSSIACTIDILVLLIGFFFLQLPQTILLPPRISQMGRTF